MTTADLAKHLQEEATCSICLDYFQDPVTIAECQHDFCRACITSYRKRSGASVCCPMCRKSFSRQNLKPNRRLENMVEAAKVLRLQLEKRPGRKRMCKEHKKPLIRFCETEKTLVCTSCERSEAHRKHRVLSTEEAAADYKISGAASRAPKRKEVARPVNPPSAKKVRGSDLPVAHSSRSRTSSSRTRARERTEAQNTATASQSQTAGASAWPSLPSPRPSKRSCQRFDQLLDSCSSASEEPPRKHRKKRPAKRCQCKKRHQKSSKRHDSDSEESTSDSEESTSDSDSEESTSDSCSEESTRDSSSEESTRDSDSEESTRDSDSEESTRDSDSEESTSDSSSSSDSEDS